MSHPSSDKTMKSFDLMEKQMVQITERQEGAIERLQAKIRERQQKEISNDGPSI